MKKNIYLFLFLMVSTHPAHIFSAYNYDREINNEISDRLGKNLSHFMRLELIEKQRKINEEQQQIERERLKLAAQQQRLATQQRKLREEQLEIDKKQIEIDKKNLEMDRKQLEVDKFREKSDEQKLLNPPQKEEKIETEKPEEVKGIAKLIDALNNKRKNLEAQEIAEIREKQKTENKPYDQAQEEVGSKYLLRFPEEGEIDYEDAGVDNSHFYGEDFNGSLLHDEGNVLASKELQPIFFAATVFNFYTYKILDFLPTFKYEHVYESKSLLAEVKEKCNVLATRFGLSELNFEAKENARYTCMHDNKYDAFTTLLPSVRAALDAFKSNQLLIDLGIAFQRWKVVMEKLPEKHESEEFNNLRRAADRLTTDLQIMIYHCMKEAYTQFIENYKSAQTSTEKTNSGTKFLPKFEPSFIDKPYYKDIIAKLNVLTKPVKEFAGLLSHLAGRKFEKPTTARLIKLVEKLQNQIDE